MVEIKKKEDEVVATSTAPAENTNVQQVFGTDEIKAPPVVAQPVVTSTTVPIVQPIVEKPKSLAETQDQNVESYKAQDGTIKTRATTGRDGITPINTVPQVKPVTTKIEQPKVSTPITKDTNWADIERKDLSSLEQLVEARYGIVATQKDGKLVGNIGGKDYAWGLNNEGNPEKTEIVKSGGEQLKQKLLNKYITASKDDLYKSLINGDIPQEIQSQLQGNPNFAEAKQKYDNKKSTDSLNSQMSNVFGVIKGEGVKEENGEEESLFKKISKSIFEGKGEEEVITKKKFMSDNYPELVKDVEDLNAKIKTKKELEEASRNTLKDIIKNNPGITKGAAILLANKQNEAINDEYRKISDDIVELGANIRYKTDIADADFQTLKQEQAVEKERQYNEKMLNEQRAYNQLLTEDERAYNQTLTEDERKYAEQRRITELEQEYAYTYGDLNSENPTLQNIAIERAVGDLYTKYPLPGMESQSAKVAKVKERMAMGMTGSEALSTVEAEIRNSQRFEDLANPPKKSEYTEFGGNLYKIDSDGNIGLAISGPKQYSKLDDGTYQDNEGNIITKDEMDLNKMVNNKYLSAEEGANVGIECGQYARSAVGMTSTPGGNSKTERIKAFSDKTPELGGMVYFTDGYDSTYGHIAVVTGINPQNGTMQVKESNYNGDNKVTVRTVPINSAKGFYNNTPLAQKMSWGTTQPTETTTGQYTDQNINDLAYLTELQDKNPTQASKDMKELGYTAKDLANYKAGNVPLTDKQKQSSISVIEDIKDLINNYDWNDATGFHFGMPVIAGTDRADTIQKVEQLVAKMTLPNLGQLKGPMSDKDLAFITKAGSNLDVGLSDEQFAKNMITAYNLAARRVGIPEITKLSEIPKGRILPGQGGIQNIDGFKININGAGSLQSDEQAELQKLFNN